jgi:hypothetical protein
MKCLFSKYIITGGYWIDSYFLRLANAPIPTPKQQQIQTGMQMARMMQAKRRMIPTIMITIIPTGMA